jgi:hypothetical protein
MVEAKLLGRVSALLFDQRLVMVQNIQEGQVVASLVHELLSFLGNFGLVVFAGEEHLLDREHSHN